MHTEYTHRALLAKLARDAMVERGLHPDFSPAVLAEVEGSHELPISAFSEKKDLRHLLWCSIDNDDSRDLDQLSLAVPEPDGHVRVLVAIADVDALVPKGSKTDLWAAHNTTSVYTPAVIFPMLPERFSTDLTSLNPGVDRSAMVIDMRLDSRGILVDYEIYEAIVHNQAQLAYDAVAAWLDNLAPMPEAMARVPGLADNVTLQYAMAVMLRAHRHARGSLDFETIETKPVFEGDTLVDLHVEKRSTSKDIIEEFMVAANGCTARFLTEKGYPTLRRVVKVPKRWDAITEVALKYGTRLPETPDSKALDAFLLQQRDMDPVRFPDLSLTIIKLLGAGEYVLMMPGGSVDGHFGLAIKDYAHSTAPNRRYPDLITQRLLKAALAAKKSPYTKDELEALANRCTEAEDLSKKLERFVRKCSEAILLEDRIGEEFDGVVSGLSTVGAWARVVTPPVEGKLLPSNQTMYMGKSVHLRLEAVNVEKGFIDFRAL
ncbi:ribonuclease II [Candidatus Gracilibacteria bacterium CG17_big_fil_post_rev_8_21_14_2_50_48_13]|nr:MAG: ribonuclease II [Candidatus Gracilibacteria bacterium CG17_big_fil_post_rev_8_21_14_2_50_48_13]